MLETTPEKSVVDAANKKRIGAKTPHDLFLAGRNLLDKGNAAEAAVAFEIALRGSPEEPLYMSYLGLALAESRQKRKNALELCEKAARRQFFQADLFYNLGRVYLMSGKRLKARAAFQEGAQVDSSFTKNIAALELMGIRSNPFFSFLDRKHLLNRIAGRAMAKLGMRHRVQVL